MATTATAAQPALEEGTVHVWRIPLDLLPCPPFLSREERERAQRRRGEARRRFVARHAAARAIVARYLGCSPADAPLAIPYGERPCIVGSPIEISLSHTGGLALLALARSPVGVDVESIDSLPPEEIDDLAEFALAPEEFAVFAELPPEKRRDALLTLWTRKEAQLKALGIGIGDAALSEMTVISASDEERLDDSLASAGEWSLHDLALGPGFVGAIAVLGDPRAVELFAWSDARDDS